MNSLGIIFMPAVPVALVAVLGVLSVAAVALAIYLGLKGWWLRALALALLVLALLGPHLREEERESLPNIAFLVTDGSASVSLEERASDIAAAAEGLARDIPGLSSTQSPFELIRVDVAPDGEEGTRGTRLLTALDEAAARVSPDQIAGAVLLTDGQIHDAERLESFPGPVHALIAGNPDGFDLRLGLETAPTFGIVGDSVVFRLTAEALGTLPEGLGPSVPATISIDGATPRPFALGLDQTTDLVVDITHGGPNVVDIQIIARPDELTDRNNRVLATVNGVRDRLRVLLVSGEPHPGGRTWRDLLKSDPTVDLIHFTILRPPAKQDGTPVSELSLIAFPTRELFLEKIDGFDLIVFDRYRWRGVLSAGYLANVARYVEDGGAVLAASGPAFAGAQSLNRTPLANVLPAEPTLNVIEEPYVPRVTDLGKRHPVTAGLEEAAGQYDDGPAWGRWLRQIEVEETAGHTVMSGHEERPLLILDRIGEGRMALLASDHAWLWSRGFDGGGPQADLLRRVAHWLMREPELEEEAMFATVEGSLVEIERRSLAEEGPDAVFATPPDGGPRRTIAYEPSGPGRWSAVLEDAGPGLWRLDDGRAETVAAVGPPSPAEYANPLASPALLAPLAVASGGAARWLVDGTPDLRAVPEGRRMSGRSWIGLAERDSFRVTGVRLVSLIPLWLAATLIGLLMLGAWLLEGRARSAARAS